ncbi:MAG: GAF domain-containing protein [Archangiaceae bacterium]|nr:GAF domain-containing protein [Archangiaceae bacterium]
MTLAMSSARTEVVKHHEARLEREALRQMHEVNAAFAAANTVDDVVAVIFERVLPVAGGTVGTLALRRPGTDLFELKWTHGVAPQRVATYKVFGLDAPLPAAEAAREQQPVFVENEAELEARFPAVAEASAYRALMTLPLFVRSACIGTLTIAYPQATRFDTLQRALAGTIATQCALALDRAHLFERENEAKQRAQFVAEASAVLTRSLDPDTVLAELTRIAVPRMGDWCSVELATGPGEARQVAVAHLDPGKVDMAREFRRRFPPDPKVPYGLFEVLRTGKPELYAEIPEAAVLAGARNEDELRILRGIGMRSGICVPLNAGGRTLGALSLVWAETDRRYTQADVELVTEVCNRAALAVENARLYEEVRRAVQLRDDFLSIAGHEMRTPLAALLLHLQTSLRAVHREGPEAAAKMKDRLERGVANVSRLERLVTQLLDVSRLTASGLKLEPEDVELSGLVEDVVGLHRDDAQHSSSPLTFSSGGPLEGRWDRLRLQQVVSNLLSNAIKYGRGSPVQVETVREGQQAVIRVRDHGIGIARENQQRIFERFERAVSLNNYGGLGLGLFIAREAVEASGGTISVTSEPGKGATFEVRLPL